MSDIHLIISNLNTKVEQIVTDHQRLKQESGKLREQNQEFQNAIKQQKREIDELREKYKIVKLAKSLEGTNERSSDVKLKINELVREVDKCIAMLNR